VRDFLPYEAIPNEYDDYGDPKRKLSRDPWAWCKSLFSIALLLAAFVFVFFPYIAGVVAIPLIIFQALLDHVISWLMYAAGYYQ
jgi:hypothetical protein